MKDTADIRERMVKLWRLVDQKEISTSEVRIQISIARTILDSLKVEIAAAHLNQSHITAVDITRHEGAVTVPLTKGRRVGARRFAS